MFDTHSWDIKLNTRRAIPYLRAPIYYPLFSYSVKRLQIAYSTAMAFDIFICFFFFFYFIAYFHLLLARTKWPPPVCLIARLIEGCTVSRGSPGSSRRPTCFVVWQRKQAIYFRFLFIKQLSHCVRSNWSIGVLRWEYVNTVVTFRFARIFKNYFIQATEHFFRVYNASS